MAVIAIPIIAAAIAKGAGVAGTVALGIITGVATAAGAMLDRMFLFPAIFGDGQDEVDGVQFNDQRMQNATPGAPINRCMGLSNRVTGTILHYRRDASTFTEVGGGKGGGGVERENLFASFYMLFAEAPVNDIVEITADSKVIYETQNLVNVIGTASAGYKFHSGSWNWEVPDGDTRMTSLVFVQGAPEYFAGITTGTVTVNGFSTPEFNGTHNIRKRSFDNDAGNAILETDSLLHPFVDPYPFPVENNVPFTSFQQDPPSFSTGIVGAVRVNRGTATQDPDPMVESLVGVTSAPAYRGWTTAAIERLALRDFGNRPPTFYAKIQGSSEQLYLDEALIMVLDAAGFAPNFYSVTQVPSVPVRGLVSNGPQPIKKVLEALLMYGNLDVINDGGRLVFFERGQGPTVEISSRLVGNVEGQPDQAGEGVTTKDADEATIPTEVAVSYLDFDRNLEKGSRTYLRMSHSDANVDGTKEYYIPVTMTSRDGRRIARQLLETFHGERQQASFTLPPSHAGITPGMILTIVDEDTDEERDYRITKSSRGANWITECEGWLQRGGEIDPTELEDEDEPDYSGEGIPPGGIYAPSDSYPMIYDCPALSDDYISTFGMFLSSALLNPDAEFRGSAVYRSASQDGLYGSVASFPDEATLLQSESELPEGPVGYMDAVNTVDVVAYHGELRSVTEDELFAGYNVLWLGRELLQFQTVTVIGTDPFRYRLSNLLRGLRDTPTSGHTIPGEWGFHVNFQRMVWYPMNLSDIGEPAWWKSVSQGQDPADPSPIRMDYSGANVRPFAPTNLQVDWDSDPVRFTWDRRTRVTYNPWTGLLLPQVEPNELYTVELYNSIGGLHDTYETSFPEFSIPLSVMENTISLPTDPPVPLDEGLGYTQGDPVRVRLWQVGDFISQGNVLDEEVS